METFTGARIWFGLTSTVMSLPSIRKCCVLGCRVLGAAPAPSSRVWLVEVAPAPATQLGWSERGGRRLRLPVKVPPPAPPATDHSLPPGTGTVKIHN